MARKQTQLHKIAMVIAASEGDSMVLTAEHLRKANGILAMVEEDLHIVYRHITRSGRGRTVQLVIEYVKRRREVALDELRAALLATAPGREGDDAIRAAVQAGYIVEVAREGQVSVMKPTPKAYDGDPMGSPVVQ